ncbi:unnamed protein product [Cunninghamella echinulata]
MSLSRPIREQPVLNEYNSNNNISNISTISTSATTTATTITPTIQDLILNRSLYEFIHPEERALAQSDLTCFLRRKTLLGAVTRCRLRSFQSIAKSLYSNQPYHEYVEEPYTWNIVNVVTYSVTDHIVLAFFHNSDDDLNNTICGEQAFNSIDTTMLLSILYKYHPVDSTTVTTTTTTTNNRTFQIYDRSLKNRYISWPPSSFYHNNDLDTSLKDNYHSSTNSCMQHAHTQSLIIHPTSPSSSSTSFSTSSSSAISSSSTITMNDTSSYKLERIVINYGGITFYTFETTAIYPPSSSSSHATYTSSIDSQYPFIKLSSKVDIPSMNNNNNNTMKHNHIPSPPKQIIEPRRHSTQHNQSRNHQDRICYECGRQSSLEWRRGPAGHKTLCNACGLRYSRQMKQLQQQQEQERQEQERQHQFQQYQK